MEYTHLPLTNRAIYGTLCRDAFSLNLWRTPEFRFWYDTLEPLEKVKVDGRLEKLTEAHFGDSRSLQGGLFELRWKNGMRVYYTRRRVRNIDTIILWGGFKGTQQSDIDRSRCLQARYENEFKNSEKDV
jgi:putative addiction module killer protein